MMPIATKMNNVSFAQEGGFAKWRTHISSQERSLDKKPLRE